jgi:hypothetical protein
LEALFQMQQTQTAQGSQADGAVARGISTAVSERADLIGSVFANKNSATPSSSIYDNHQKRILEQQHQLMAQQMGAAAKTADNPSDQKHLERKIQLEHYQNQNLHRQLTQADLDDSKTTILPCRARGMPMDHNVKVRSFSATRFGYGAFRL